ncbi:MAG TPA: family 1 glycosylhydrolase [Capsulimonadaceae bacterium]|jgi:dTDP-4-dehydrorhamnose reductase
MSAQYSPQLWGGIECTLNRVGSTVLDQVKMTGHDRRVQDLDLFAELGFEAMRYPILWERVAPNGLESADWSWADERLLRLRELGIEPIVGLLHHGSGPADTDLLDDAFPRKLAAYAKAIAQRYPWIQKYTPVNEPLTTARFAGLYGHWHPHARDERVFARILLNQCRAISLSMEAIRDVNPDAELVQTEDCGITHSTPKLRYQAEFQNERRWLSFDLLTGCRTLSQSMRDHLAWLGVSTKEIKWFEERPERPLIVGLDYYVSSERFLDERLERYPHESWGGNGIDDYADVEAVRVRAEGLEGFAGTIREAWARYGQPIAITEAHLACSVLEQIRWVGEAWQAANSACAAGMDVRGVTAWALLGAYDWDSLVTRQRGHYESGAFAMNSEGVPMPTELATFIGQLRSGRYIEHEALSDQGWWNRDDRLLYEPVSCRSLPRAASLPVVGSL